MHTDRFRSNSARISIARLRHKSLRMYQLRASTKYRLYSDLTYSLQASAYRAVRTQMDLAQGSQRAKYFDAGCHTS